MGGITEARAIIVNFFHSEFDLPKEAIQVVGLVKKGEEWWGSVIITQANQYLRILGYPPVFDKNTYTIVLDMDMNIILYRLGELEKEED